MTDDDLCLAHYRMIFPNAGSLGSGTPPSIWQQEYDRVAATGLSSTLIVGQGADGSSATAVRNFDQRVLLRSLLLRRAELDSVFDEAIFYVIRPAVKV